jgi:hypothetical protein
VLVETVGELEVAMSERGWQTSPAEADLTRVSDILLISWSRLAGITLHFHSPCDRECDGSRFSSLSPRGWAGRGVSEALHGSARRTRQVLVFGDVVLTNSLGAIAVTGLRAGQLSAGATAGALY